MALLQTQFQSEYTYLEIHAVRTYGKMGHHCSVLLVLHEAGDRTEEQYSAFQH